MNILNVVFTQAQGEVFKPQDFFTTGPQAGTLVLRKEASSEAPPSYHASRYRLGVLARNLSNCHESYLTECGILCSAVITHLTLVRELAVVQGHGMWVKRLQSISIVAPTHVYRSNLRSHYLIQTLIAKNTGHMENEAFAAVELQKMGIVVELHYSYYQQLSDSAKATLQKQETPHKSY